jgi:hypothetical protein
VPLFKRKRQPDDGAGGPGAGGPRDPELPLSVDQAALLRRLVREAFAERGVEVTLEGAALKADDGQQYFLHNLAAGVAPTPEAEWPEQAARFAASLLEHDDVETLTEAQLEAMTYLRLQPADITDVTNQPSAAGPVPGLVTLLAIDLPTTVITPAEAFWVERGGLERWRAVGERNLAALIGSEQVERHQVADHDYAFTVLAGDSFFTATLALLMDRVLPAYDPTDRVDTALGALVAVPHRQQLAWRVLDRPGAVPTLDALVRFTVLGNADGPGPVSPHLYWVRAGVWERLTEIAEDGTVSVTVSPELQAALEQLLG